MEAKVDRGTVLLLKTSVSYAIVTLTLAAMFALGFLTGFLPWRGTRAELSATNQRLLEENGALKPQVAQLQQSVERLQADLKLAELRGTAGLMSQRVNRNDFGAAAELSSDFFNGVREILAVTDDAALKKSLQNILDQRDAVTAALAQANPAVKEQLAQIYTTFFGGTRAG